MMSIGYLPNFPPLHPCNCRHECSKIIPMSERTAQNRQTTPYGYRVSGIGYRVSGIGYRVSGIGYRVSGIGYRVSGIGYRDKPPIILRTHIDSCQLSDSCSSIQPYFSHHFEKSPSHVRDGFLYKSIYRTFL
jgi:hypothetical protein